MRVLCSEARSPDRERLIIALLATPVLSSGACGNALPQTQKSQRERWLFCLNPGGRCKFRTCDPSSVNAVLYP